MCHLVTQPFGFTGEAYYLLAASCFNTYLRCIAVSHEVEFVYSLHGGV